MLIDCLVTIMTIKATDYGVGQGKEKEKRAITPVSV
ncbi:hypothetical protein EPIR_1234 [Erwinia piriflorinigrans CFBP 5888]|uniref:Uncharacterized protein n=1 Tax=Erwinia piriflorinigrans CFBP 5888 TaxID=1161919 RepID=V5Z6J9_9GAMM|nr:hypothetical protein EPIR_1234 [Erwinia piriflorinigrans CFBP 5888]